MKTLLKTLLLIVLSLILLFGLSSCVWRTYHFYDFEFVRVRGKEKYADYFTEPFSEQLEFAKIENVVITADIQIDDYNESEDYIDPLYRVLIYAYSETGTENVIIKSVTIKENDNVLLNYELNQSCEFKRYDYDPSAYQSRTVTELFNGEAINADHDKSYSLLVDVELIKDDEVISKTITHKFVTKGYWRTTLP